MKLLIIQTLVALTVAEWELKTRQEWFNIQDFCNERYQKPREFRDKHKDDKYPPKEEFHMILCYLRGLELWNESEGYLIDRMMMGLESVTNNNRQNNALLLRQSLENCTSDRSSTDQISPFDWAYRCFKCFMDDRNLLEALKRARFYKINKDTEE